MRKIATKKENKRIKAEFIKKLSEKLYYKRKLFSEILISLDINNIKNTKSLNNLKLEDIERVKDFYNKVEEQTIKLGGDDNKEDDLLLGLEEMLKQF